MNKFIIKNKHGEEIQTLISDDPNYYPLKHPAWGLDERVVLADSDYDIADVIEEIPAVTETRTRTVTIPESTEIVEHEAVLDEEGNIVTEAYTETVVTPEHEIDEEYTEIITPAMVRLKAEYTIEGPIDMTAEIKWQEYQTLRANILSEKYDFLEVASWLSDDSRLRAITFRKEVRMLRKHLTKDNIMDFDLGSIKTFSFEYDVEYRVEDEQPKVIHF